MTFLHIKLSNIKIFYFLIALGFLLFSRHANCQVQTLYYTGFESGGSWPTGWTQEYVEPDWDGYYISWYITSGGSNPSGAYSGTYYAKMQNYWYGGKTRLVMPVINFGIYKKNPKLKFYHFMRNWAGDQDRLRIFYKTSATGTWTQIVAYTSDVSSWTLREIDLPNVGNTYYIAFEGETMYGYGVCIDEVRVEASPLLPDAGITAIVSPQSPFSVGIQNVTVTLKSFEEINLTSCRINWSVNGVTQPSYYWTGNLAKDETQNVTLGTYNFNYPPQGPFNPFTIAVWTSNPNGGQDANPDNDLFTKSVSPILNDAGVVGIFGPPEGFAPGLADVRVRVYNYAPKPLSSVTIEWSVEGTPQVPRTFTGLNVQNGQTIDLTIGQYNFSQPRIYSIRAKTVNPNGVADEVQSNDEYIGGFGPSLGSGTYTIGGVGSNFSTLCDFINYLKGSGIFGTGTVVAEIRNGTYDCQNELFDYAGNNNLVIIQSASGNPNDVTIQYTPTIAKNYVLKLDGAKNIKFMNVTIRNNASSTSNAGRIFDITNSSNISFENVVFIGVQNPTNLNYNQLLYINNSNNYVLKNCKLNFGSYAIFDATTNDCNKNVLIQGNLFNGQNYAGIYSFNTSNCSTKANNFIVKENSFGASVNMIPHYGIYSIDAINHITENSFSSIRNGAGIFVSNTSSNLDKIIVNSNRMLGFTSADGIHLESVYDAEVMNNDITINGYYNAGIKLFNVGWGGYFVFDNGNLPNMPLIRGNKVNATDAYGIYAEYGSAIITHNYLNSITAYSGSGFSALYSNGMAGLTAMNQCIGQKASGIQIYSPMGLELYYNSVHSTGQYDAALTIYPDYYYEPALINTYENKKKNANDEISTYSYGIKLMRNLFINTGGGYVFSGDPSDVTSDENNWYTSGQYFSDSYPTFNNWKTNTGQDHNSSNVPVNFKNPDDLHITQYNPDIYKEYPLFDPESPLFEEIERYDWDNEERDDIFYYGVDNVRPIVSIITQPEPYVACINGTTSSPSFVVVANVSLGGEPIYQWQKDGKDIPGANSAVYTIDNSKLKFDHSGVYRCIVSGTGRAKPVTTNEVLLYVVSDPEITRDPVDVVVDIGGTAVFEVQAHIQHTGEPIARLSYQWYKNNLNNPLNDDDRIAGSKSSILTIRHVNQNDYNDEYFVIATGLCGSATSMRVKILKPADVSIVGQPVDQNVCESSVATFVVTANIIGGGDYLEYQWYKDGNPLNDDFRIIGSNTSTLVISAVEAADIGNYQVKVTVYPSGKYKLSNPASLIMKELPRITADLPESMIVEQGRELTLTVSATGYEPLYYQWYKDGDELPGETDDTYTNPAVTTADEGVYKVKVYNECGEVWSIETQVTVNVGGHSSITEVSRNGYTLFGTIPNPINGVGLIRFISPEASEAKIVLTDSYGKTVAVLFNDVTQKGLNEVKFNVDNLGVSSGVYYYTLIAKGFIATMKMVIVK